MNKLSIEIKLFIILFKLAQLVKFELTLILGKTQMFANFLHFFKNVIKTLTLIKLKTTCKFTTPLKSTNAKKQINSTLSCLPQRFVSFELYDSIVYPSCIIHSIDLYILN